MDSNEQTLAAVLMEKHQRVFDELKAAMQTSETESHAPLDSILAERQQLVLVDALDISWKTNEHSVPLAHARLFSSLYCPPTVSDMLLSLGVKSPSYLRDFTHKKYRAYPIWQHRKPSKFVRKVASNNKGQGLDEKLNRYAAIGVEYYKESRSCGLDGSHSMEHSCTLAKTYTLIPAKSTNALTKNPKRHVLMLLQTSYAVRVSSHSGITQRGLHAPIERLSHSR
ncbi:MAG: hypothetical protein RML40_07170 [Bacteroidota bacterium]|nr:hypothetical protein [Candidatus Kapabacteria bacterium]MDW8220297.1 hypothetical protein [Bacteroidota bacterium]